MIEKPTRSTDLRRFDPRRLLRVREVRKFLRNRMALAALVVIAAYGVVALAIMTLGVISEDDTSARVGPNSLAGFFTDQRPEKRLRDCEFYLDTAERYARRIRKARGSGAEELLEAEALAERVYISDPDVIDDIAGEGWKLYDEIAESEDLDEEPAALPTIEKIEALCDQLFEPMSGLDGFIYDLRLLWGTDRQGGSVSVRATYAVKIAVQVGLVTALLSVIFGSLLGAAAAFYGGLVDHLVIFLYSVFSSIPNLVLLTVLVYMFTGSVFENTLIPLYTAFCATFWIGPCRVIRGETLKLKQLEYIQAATAIGFGRFYILLKHIIPNTAHLMFINFSLLFIGAIKSEVILTFLGLGVKSGASWGIMISDSGPEVLKGEYWQLSAATLGMFGLVFAFNIVSDALQDAFDPKHV